MRKFFLGGTAALVLLATPATANAPMDKSDVRSAVRTAASESLAALLDQRDSAPIRIGTCRLANGNGSCRVRVYGTARCVGRFRVRGDGDGGSDVWASWLRCR